MHIEITKPVAGCPHFKVGQVLEVDKVPDALKFSCKVVEPVTLEVATPEKKPRQQRKPKA